MTGEATLPPFWADDFDMDLIKILPQTVDILGDTADIPLWTHGRTTNGLLNHPSVWNTHTGPTAYFGLDDSGRWKPRSHYTDQPLMACTWLEAVRDAWPHTYVLCVNRVPVWDTNALSSVFDSLMADLRGWYTLPANETDKLREQVADSLVEATAKLRALATPWPASTE